MAGPDGIHAGTAPPTTPDAGAPGEPELIVVPDLAAGAQLAAERIAARLRGAVEGRGRADWATTGGSNPIEVYRRIMETSLVDEIPWAQTHVWWGDDRFVPRDHPLSNVKAFDDVVLRLSGGEGGTAPPRRWAPIPFDQVHPFPNGETIAHGGDPAVAAGRMAGELAASGVPMVDGWPAFDLILVGIGGDGHLFSIFPGSPAIGAKAVAMGIPAPTHIEPHVPRVTLNPAVLDVAVEPLVIVFGESKASVMAEIFGTRRPTDLPAQLVRREGAVWILDEAAAAHLRR